MSTVKDVNGVLRARGERVAAPGRPEGAFEAVRVRLGRGSSAFSPFGHESTPSAVYTINQDGVTGYLTSLRAADRLSDGSNAVAYMRRDATGVWWCRPSRRTAAFLRGRALLGRFDGTNRAHKYWGDGGRGPIGVIADVPASRSRLQSARSVRAATVEEAGVGFWADYRTRHPVVGSISSRTGRRLRTYTTGDLYRCLEIADRRNGPVEQERAEIAGWVAENEIAMGLDRDPRDAWPDKFVSGYLARPTTWNELHLKDGRDLYVPVEFEPAAVTHVLIDLDDFKHVPEDAHQAVATSLELALVGRDPLLTGRAAALQTSPRGLHVVAELATPRWRPWEWVKNVSARRWREDVASDVLEHLRRRGFGGGHVDPGPLHSKGPLVRRPGWRLLPNGRAFRTRLLAMARR